MSSREIAELLDVRHDSVKRTIERLADRDVIGLPRLEGVRTTSAVRVLDADERTTLNRSEVGLGKGAAINAVSRPGLFKLIQRSDKPGACHLPAGHATNGNGSQTETPFSN